MKAALRNRMQWLTEQGLTQTLADGAARLSANVFAYLKRKELQRTTDSITTKSGLAHASPIEGEAFSGTYKHTVNLASGK